MGAEIYDDKPHELKLQENVNTSTYLTFYLGMADRM